MAKGERRKAGQATTASGNGNNQQTAGGGSGMKRVNEEKVTEWANANRDRAVEFAFNPPESITVNGVEFQYMGGEPTKIVHAKSTRYYADFQSKIQASNGEWPVIQVVTEARRRGKTTQYDLVTSGYDKTKLW